MDGNILARFEFFADIDPASRDAIAEMAELREFAPGTIVFRDGDPADAIFGLLEGNVDLSLLFRDRILKTDEIRYEEAIRARFVETETPVVFKEVHDGQIFGWSALAGLEKRTATARTVDAARAFAIPAAALRRRMSEDPILGFRLMDRLSRIIAGRLHELSGQMVEAWVEAFGAGRI